MEGYIQLFFILKKWCWKTQTSCPRQGRGSAECLVSTIIHMTVLLPMSTRADDSPARPFQMTLLSQPDWHFKQKLPKWQHEQRHWPPCGLTYTIRHSVQMRCWEKLAPKHGPSECQCDQGCPVGGGTPRGRTSCQNHHKTSGLLRLVCVSAHRSGNKKK